MTFPERLRQLFTQTGAQKIELAEYADVARQTIDNYLRGDSEPGINIVLKIRDFFKERYNLTITIDDLIGEPTEKVRQLPENQLQQPDDENPYIKQENNIIRFDLARIEKGKERLCKCKIPHYEIDAVNRLVMCSDCGAVMDSFEVLRDICRRWEAFEDYQKKALDKIAAYSEEANRQFNRRMRNGWFKDMEREYLNRDMLPVCPHCQNPFDPIDCVNKINRAYSGEAWKVNKTNISGGGHE